MRKAREFARSHPRAAALALVGFYFAVFFLPPLFSDQSFGRGKGIAGAVDMTAQLRLEIALVLSVLAAVWLIGWWRECRFTISINAGGLKFLAFPYLFASLLLGLVSIAVKNEGSGEIGSAVTPSLLAGLIAVTFMIGMFEETLFRGILFHGLETGNRIIVAVVGSSLIFALMHYVNWVGGQPFMLTTGQVIHAFAAGFMYAALMLRIGSIWPVILFHGFWDATVALIGTLGQSLPDAASASQGSGIVVTFVFFGFEFAYGLLVLLSWRRMSRGNS